MPDQIHLYMCQDHKVHNWAVPAPGLMIARVHRAGSGRLSLHLHTTRRNVPAEQISQLTASARDLTGMPSRSAKAKILQYSQWAKGIQVFQMSPVGP